MSLFKNSRNEITQSFGLLLALILCLLWPSSAHAEYHALIVGNSEYERANDLRNPQNDAVDLAGRLSELGYSISNTEAHLDLTKDQFEDAVQDFSAQLEPGDVALVYYAGHGVQIDGENYLIPVDDTTISTSDDIRRHGIEVSDILTKIQIQDGISLILILDACRDNPFRNSDYAAGDGRGLSIEGASEEARGLAPIEAREGTVIAFAAAAGATASDGPGDNGLFTEAFLTALELPDRDIIDLMNEVRARVWQTSGGRQMPWTNTSLLGRVCFTSDCERLNEIAEIWRRLNYSSTYDSETIRLYEQLCDLNDAPGCVSLGRSYQEGAGVRRDYSTAISYFEHSCDNGDAVGCAWLGDSYLHGKGVSQSNDQAYFYFELACELGGSLGCMGLGTALRDGIGVEQNHARAAYYFEMGCNQGDLFGCGALALAYRIGQGVEQNHNEANDLLRTNCDAGDPEGCAFLATAYRIGQGVTVDQSIAGELYQRSCRMGWAAACVDFGVALQNGTAQSQNLAEAAEYFQMACEGNIAYGCGALGTAYFDGAGVERNERRAVELWEMACEGQNAWSCTRMGLAYREGTGGIQPDMARANNFWRQACDLGNADGCVGLSLGYRFGIGLEQDLEEANRLWQRGCELGEPRACSDFETWDATSGK